MLDLAFIRGKLAGERYGRALLKPACGIGRPACPHWCPVRHLVWRIGFSIGLHEVLRR